MYIPITNFTAKDSKYNNNNNNEYLYSAPLNEGLSAALYKEKGLTIEGF